MSRILIVTIGLVGRSGTEVVAAETAFGLRNRGHTVALFTSEIGPFGAAMQQAGLLVVDDITALPWTPDLIQANQTFPLIAAAVRFPDVPCIAICHDSVVWHSEPIDLPTIRRDFAVDIACRDRIVGRLPHLRDQVELLHNAVDLDRFQMQASLPARPRRALIVAKHGTQDDYIDTICKACAAMGLHVDVVGTAIGDEVADLHLRFPRYDIVFAAARVALEAMAAGCAVVVVDGRGFAGMVNLAVVSAWRDNNFGGRLLARKTSFEAMAKEIERYDPGDAGRVAAYVRDNAALSKYLDRLECIHDDVIHGVAAPIDRNALILALGGATAALIAALERAHAGAAEVQSRRYDTMLASRSWRLTAPLRGLLQQARRAADVLRGWKARR